MKTKKNIYEKICSYENLEQAYFKCREGKRKQKQILKFGFNLEKEIANLQNELLTGTYEHGKYYHFTIEDSKKREIQVAPFRDRVVHRAIYDILVAIYEPVFIHDSYACRVGKGTHIAVKRLEKFLFSLETKNSYKEIYCLQCDIRKYFDSVDHDILLKILKKKIACGKTLSLLEKIVRTVPSGIPLGNLTSQIFANVYLNELDQFVKHKLKQKYFLRYMDDFLILGTQKKELDRLKEECSIFLNKELHLKLHPKKVKIFPAYKGVEFLGYRVFKGYRLLRKTTVKRFCLKTKKKLKKISEEELQRSLKSWGAYAIHANSWKLRREIFFKFEK